MAGGELLEIGGAPPRRPRVPWAAAIGLLAAGLVLGAVGGRVLEQRAAAATDDGAVRLTAVMTSTTRMRELVGQGEIVKVLGDVVNTGPGRVGIAALPSSYGTVVLADHVDSGGTVQVSAQVPFVCRGPSIGDPPSLSLRVTPADGQAREIVLALAGEEPWKQLGLVCLARAASAG